MKGLNLGLALKKNLGQLGSGLDLFQYKGLTIEVKGSSQPSLDGGHERNARNRMAIFAPAHVIRFSFIGEKTEE